MVTQRQRDILTATRRLVASAGVESTSLRAVGKAVGTTAPALYRHYADRDALLAAVAVEVAGELAASLAMPSTAVSPAASLVEQGRRYLRFAAEQPHLHALTCAHAGSLPPVRDALATLVHACCAGASRAERDEAVLEWWALLRGLAALAAQSEVTGLDDAVLRRILRREARELAGRS